ncbi:MAG: alpha-glucan family phosphorylase [Acidimicrobiales bacterium]
MDTHGLSESLSLLAANHRWTWSAEIRSVFERLPGFDVTRHPASLVADLQAAQLTALLDDETFVADVIDHTATVRALADAIPAAPEVAYFSPEFGITDVAPQYSGGLGILAGDHLKAASDLGVSLCAVGLFYRGGFFRQDLVDGRQRERFATYDPTEFGCVDTGATVDIPMGRRTVTARIWRMDVGRIALVLLDTDVDTNAKADRSITDRLYSGDRRHRIEQELVLGVGGSRAIEALGWDAPVRHLNEGHAGFLILDLLDAEIAAGATLADAIETVRPRLVFTTHTPVPAGIDRFDIAMATEYLEPWAAEWGVPVADVLALGHDDGDDPAAFNMAALCLRAAGVANGVSKLHGEVSRELFAGVPGGTEIGSVTNGVHARTWVAPRLQETFDEILGTGWAEGDPAAWQKVSAIDDDTVRAHRRAGGVDLADLVASRTSATIDPDALIIGFARRFATYKRATLLLQHPEALTTLLADDDRPVQFLFAGKAHPADEPGKALLAEVVAFGETPEAHGRFLFLPDYDIAVAQAMYAGCDVWLNNPVRPHEASGTSGEKSALNGGLNLSISDGWWAEMADGRNGWTIPSSDATDPAIRDREESAAALALLADAVVPEFYGPAGGLSPAWIERVRDNWRSLGPRVTAARMVTDYCTDLYGPALAASRGR